MDDLIFLEQKKTTVKDIDAFAKQRSIVFPGGLKKQQKIDYLKSVLNNTDKEVMGYRDQVVDLLPLWSPRGNDKEARKESYKDWKDDLKEYGWCVVPIPGWKKDFVSMFFDWLESCSENFLRDDPNTWKTSNMIPMLHGIIKQGMGQTELQYLIRELCAPLFADLWNIPQEDLLCSFDGGCFLKSRCSSGQLARRNASPSTALNTKVKKRRNEKLDFNIKDLWVHVDTPRPELIDEGEEFPEELECYQGIVNFVDCDEYSGGLVLVKPKEERKEFFLQYMANHPSAGYKWTRAQTVDAAFDEVTYVKVCAPAGHLILWDGTLFHCNVPPTKVDPAAYRMCLYVSMQPRERATKKELEKRIKLYETGRMTGHWCSGPYFEANAKKPRTYGKEDIILPPEPEIAPLNELRARLIGYDKY